MPLKTGRDDFHVVPITPLLQPSSMNSTSEIERELSLCERLVWTGQPAKGIRLRASDAFMIPFSLLWCGFAIFWETTAINNGAPVFFRLWGMPFILVGLYIVFGRFFADAMARERTFLRNNPAGPEIRNLKPQPASLEETAQLVLMCQSLRPIHRKFQCRHLNYRLGQSHPASQYSGMKTKTSQLLPAACRWTARIVGTLLVAICGFIAIGQGIPNPTTQPILVQIGFLALALIATGILAAWRWELTGAIISLTGWSMFVLAVCSPTRLNSFVFALAFPGVLYLSSALLRRNQERRASA